jgi:hypothetical protein
MTGRVVSTTVTVWLHCAKFVQASLTRQVRVAVKVLPQVALVTVLTMAMDTFVPPQPSFAVGAVKLQALPHSTTKFDAQFNTGAVVSTTVTVWPHTALLEQLSVARQVRMATKVLPQNPD